MTPEDSVTEGETLCPLGVQCQVHCTPLSQTSAQAVADRLRRVGRGSSGVGGVKVEQGLEGGESQERSF